MIFYQNSEGKTYKKERESWKELFHVFVIVSLNEKWLKNTKKWWWCCLQKNWVQDGYDYWILPLFPFVLLFYGIKKRYFDLAFRIYKKGYLKHIKGEKVSWFWFIKLKFKK